VERERSVDKALDSVNRARGTGQPAEETQLRRETSEHVAAFEAGSGTVGIVEKETATEHRKPAVAGRARTPDRLSPAGLETEKILDGEVNGRHPPQDQSHQSSFDEANSLTQRIMGGHARLYAAHTDSGRYSGEIVGATAGHIVQKLNPRSAVAHPKDLLPGVPEVGQHLTITYSNGKAVLKAFELRTKTRELAR
jgi:hypothetical protein